MIEAKIIADSVNKDGKRLTTFVVKYNRYIIAELGTHRMLSRNSASSRAIPVSKLLRAVYDSPAKPVSWGINVSGMQAKGELNGWRRWLAENIWVLASYFAISCAWLLAKLSVHKQVTNRLLEPWCWTTTIISATEWANFFNLRCHRDAQPEFQELAYKMLEAYVASEPKLLQDGEWHLPFADQYLDENLSIEEKLKIVSARCARVSYLNFEGDIDHNKDYDLHDKLIGGETVHASPTEHAAMAWTQPLTPEQTGNFKGFIQYRKTIPGENQTVLDPDALFARRRPNA